jgi:hypothetical protein
VRKLILTSILAGLVVVPTAFAATDAPSFAPVRDALTDTPRANSVPAPRSEGHNPRREVQRMPAVRAGRADQRIRQAEQARRAEAQAAAVPPHLQAIAACESGGDPTAIGGGGMYRGKYQFSMETWAAVGGSGDPAAAPEAEQDKRAALLYEQSGPGQWPVCAG